MNLSELLAKYGDDKVQFQILDECADSLNMKGKITKITFGAEQPINFGGTEKLGLVVWLDRARVAEIIAAPSLAAPLQRGEEHGANWTADDWNDRPRNASPPVARDALVERLNEIIEAFDADVADELASESGERADLWSEVDVPIGLLREAAAALAGREGTE